jgi:hypothetical protein
MRVFDLTNLGMKSHWLIFGSFNFENRHMKHFIGFLLVAVVMSCQDIEPPADFTGYETTYELVSASVHGVKGFVTFKERVDGHATIVIELSGTAGEAKHPVHLHFGNLSTPQAEVAAMLNPVVAMTGKSETTITALADETPVTYADFSSLRACIKVHLGDSGPERDIVLAGGNIGLSYTESISSGRQGFAVCKSE